MEIWQDIPGYGNHYQASNLGNIRSKDRIVEKFSYFANKIVQQKYKGKLLNPTKSNKLGHLSVHLGSNKQKWTLSVHRLILETFVGQCPDGMECCHNNGIANDNRIENLRWDTHENNNKDRKRHGTYKTGKDHHMYGKTMPKELKDKLRQINVGKKHSDQTKQKMSNSNKIRWEKIRVQKQATS